MRLCVWRLGPELIKPSVAGKQRRPRQLTSAVLAVKTRRVKSDRCVCMGDSC